MTDIVQRLRKPMVNGLWHPVDDERKEAADEIERLRLIISTSAHKEIMMGEIERLRKALSFYIENGTMGPADLKLATIERCAQVADDFQAIAASERDKSVCFDIAAAIRAKKDK